MQMVWVNNLQEFERITDRLWGSLGILSGDALTHMGKFFWAKLRISGLHDKAKLSTVGGTRETDPHHLFWIALIVNDVGCGLLFAPRKKTLCIIRVINNTIRSSGTDDCRCGSEGSYDRTGRMRQTGVWRNLIRRFTGHAQLYYHCRSVPQL